jgi:GDP-L-fucose synthase
MSSYINIGTGKDITIRDLSEIVKQITGFKGTMIFDTVKPDGTLRKLMGVSLLNDLGFVAPTPFKIGLRNTFDDYLRRYSVITD